MSQTLTVILISVAAVAFFVIGMSLTLMIKGHWIDSEISTNRHMRERGIKCALQEEMELYRGKTDSQRCGDLPEGCTGNCASCPSGEGSK